MTRHKSFPLAQDQNCISVEAFAQPEQLVAAFFKASNVGLGICDEQLRCLAVNEALAAINGISVEAHLGKSVRELVGDAADAIEPYIKKVFASGRPVFDVRICAKLPRRAEVGHWIENYFPIKDAEGKVKEVGTIVVEVTHQKKLEQSLRSVTRQLLRAQDEEQRRIARELHDSINQYHAALKMNLLRLRKNGLHSGSSAGLLDQSIELLNRCMTETRTISYLLHPPLLGEMGFAAATRWYVKGFAQRSGIKTNLKMSADLEHLPAAQEMALFRILQEALTNVHRYAHTPALDVEIQRTRGHVTLEVRDHGRGIPRRQLQRLQQTNGTGLGIAGMRERVRELGGVLLIESNGHGTRVRAQLPINRSSLQLAGPLSDEATA